MLPRLVPTGIEWHDECFIPVGDGADRGPLGSRDRFGVLGMKHLLNARIVLPAVYLLVGTFLIAG